MNSDDHQSTPVREDKPALFSWAFYDWANSAFPTLIQTFVFAAYFTRAVASDTTTATAQWGNMLAIAAVLIAVASPLLGAISDHTGRRKPWIAGFTLLCVFSSFALWFVRPSEDYVLYALVMVALGTIGVECATVFYNAMLPSLAPPERLGRWSGWGWALGYGGGLLCLVIALYALVQPDPGWFGFDREQSQHVRSTFVLVGVWFAIFSIPLFLFAPDTPATGKRFRVAAKDGAKQLIESLRHVRQYGGIVRFLIARMIYIDGMATMFSFGAVFAAGTFDMDESQVLQFGIALNVTAALGSLGFSWIDDYLGSKQTILISLVGMTIAAACMLLAPSVAMFWGFGMLLGIFVGPAQAASRSMLARMAPPNLRNQMFGLYAFSGKATSFLGPLLVGWITLASGSQRVGMAAIVVLFVVGGLLLLTVPAPAPAPRAGGSEE